MLILRHAQTDLAGTFCGHTDPPVNAAGLRQIVDLLATQDFSGIDEIYTSDLQRACTTAQAIAAHLRLPLHILPGLREIDFGHWEGLIWPQIEALDPAFSRLWTDEFPNLTPPGGEPYQAFRNRILGTLERLPEQAAVVTHAGPMRLILTEFYDLPEAEAWLQTKPYCSAFTYHPPTLCPIHRSTIAMSGSNPTSS